MLPVLNNNFVSIPSEPVGIDPTIPRHFFLVNDDNEIKFQENFDEFTCFGEITQENLLADMAGISGVKKTSDKFQIGIKAGFQSAHSNSGFSARHIIARGHTKEIHDYYATSNHCQSLIKFIKLALKSINDINHDSTDLALTWVPEKRVYVFAVDTKTQFGELQHVLMTLYPTANNQLMVGTFYLINQNTFEYIRKGNEWYRPVVIKQQSIPTTNIESSSIPEEESNNDNNMVETASTVITQYCDTYDILRSKLVPYINLLDEGINYFDLILQGNIEIDDEIRKIIDEDLKNQAESRIKLAEKQAKFYSNFSKETARQVEIIKNINRSCIKFNLKLDQTVKTITVAKKENKNNELEKIFKMRIDEDFSDFLEQYENEYKVFSKSFSVSDHNLMHSNVVSEIISLPKSLIDQTILFNKTDRKEAELNNMFQTLDLFSSARSQVNDAPSSAQTLQYEQDMQDFESFTCRRLDPTTNKLIQALDDFRVTFLEKTAQSNALKKQLEGLLEIKNKIYLNALYIANYYIKFALDNRLQNIQQYVGTTYLIAKIKEISDAVQAACKEIGNGADKHWNYFETESKKFSQKYNIGFLTKDEHTAWQFKQLRK